MKKLFIHIFISLMASQLFEIHIYAEACPNSSMEWSIQLNRCVNKQESTNYRKDSSACDKITNREEQKKCQLALASSQSGVTSDPKEALSKLDSLSTRSAMVNGAAAIISAINLAASGSGTGNTCLSKNILAATGIGGVITDVYIKYRTNKKAKEIEKKYQVDQKDSPYIGQSKALEYLKEEQNSVKEAAELEKKRQMILTAGYGASFATAAYEQFANQASCTGNKSESDTKADTKTDTKTEGAPEANTGGGANAASSGIFKSVGGFLASPTGIMIVSAIGTYNSYTLMSAASKQIDESKENIKKIEELLKTFKDSWSNYCPNGREDLKEPKCYCFLDGGGKNMNRTNSETCQKLWAKNDFKITFKESDYKSDGTPFDPVGCVTKDGTFDEGCKCKKFTDSKGENLCQKITSMNIPTNSLGAAYVKESGVSNMIDTINKLGQGQIGFGKVDGKNLAIGLNKSQKLNNALTKDLFSKSGPSAFKGLSDLELKKAQENLFPSKEMASLQSSMGPSNLFGSSMPSGALGDAIKEATKNTGLELSTTGNGLGVKKGEDKANPNFNFGDSGVQGSNKMPLEFADKNYKYKNNDITKDTGASIFELISNRYIESGMRRLFPDPAAEKK